MRASLLALTFVCCAAPASPASAPAAPATPSTPRLPAARAGVWTETLCEPSALVWSTQGWIVGDNEKEMGVYLLDDALQPTRLLAFSPDESVRVDDIEALTGDLVVGSHSRTRKGQGRDEKPDRFKVLVRNTGASGTLDLSALQGDDGARLRGAQDTDLTRTHPGLDPFNIEGAAMVGPSLLLGLRGPLDDDHKALVLVSPPPSSAGPMTVSRVLHLDLGGEGVRELTPWRDGLLVVTGPSDGDAATPGSTAPRAHHLWWWPKLDAPATRLDVSLPGSTEGAWPLDPTHLLVVIDGKKAADPAPGEPKSRRCEVPGAWAVVDVSLP